MSCGCSGNNGSGNVGAWTPAAPGAGSGTSASTGFLGAICGKCITFWILLAVLVGLFLTRKD